MDHIVKNRTIRPSSRLSTSRSYKIDTSRVSSKDTLTVNINHESNPFRVTYTFNGADVASKDSIHFRVSGSGDKIVIHWSGAIPVESKGTPVHSTKEKSRSAKHYDEGVKKETSFVKTSFDPISYDSTEILILGTLPGDRSLSLGEYYAHPGNQFWRIIAVITNQQLLGGYEKKREMLLRSKIGIWDVAHSAKRQGSLDSAIHTEIPNDLNGFITKHKNLKMICFNGTKAEALYEKYFTRNNRIKYLLLPSTSPANTGMNFDDKVLKWRAIIK